MRARCVFAVACSTHDCMLVALLLLCWLLRRSERVYGNVFVCVCLYVGICVCVCVRVLGEYVGCTMWCGGDCVRCVRTTTCAVRDVHDVECGWWLLCVPTVWWTLSGGDASSRASCRMLECWARTRTRANRSNVGAVLMRCAQAQRHNVLYRGLHDHRTTTEPGREKRGWPEDAPRSAESVCVCGLVFDDVWEDFISRTRMSDVLGQH